MITKRFHNVSFAGVFILVVTMASCADDFTGDKALTIDDIISFDTPKNASVMADGNATVDIKVDLIADGSQQVTFVTEQGAFQGATGTNKKTIVVASIAGDATARLISDQTLNSMMPVTASVTKSDKTYTNTTFVNFTTAPPEDFFLTSDKNIVKADQTAAATITLNVTRTGLSKVSSGLLANIELVTTAGTVVAEAVKFVKTVTDPASTPVTFTVRSTNANTGTVQVKVTMTGATGNLVRTKDLVFN